MTEKAYDVVVAANLKGLSSPRKKSGGYDQEPQRQDHQPRIASRDRRAPWSVGLLHDQGRRFAPHQCLAVEWGKHNINVNCVAPTYIRTPGTMGWGLDEFVERTQLLSKLPLGRIGEPIEVSGAVVFLASPAAALITGATLLIDAGYTAL